MTKLNLVNDAFVELGLAPYVYTLQPEDMQVGLSLLEALVARFDVAGIELNWPYDADPSNVIGNVVVDIPAFAYGGLVAQLAIDLAPSFGKQVTPLTMNRAKIGYETMLSISAVPNNVANNHMVPLGAGNKPWRLWRMFVIPGAKRRIIPGHHGIAADIGAKEE